MSEETKAADNEQLVPIHRLREVNDKRLELEARIKQLEAANQAARQAAQGLTEYQAAARIGVTDPELYEAARWAYNRLPEADRPAFPEALEAWKSDPNAAPLVLRPHLAPAPAPQAAAPQAAPAPNPNQGAQTFEAAPKAVDVMSMSLEQYRQHRDRFKGTSLI
jgi:hypothetical protein